MTEVKWKSEIQRKQWEFFYRLFGMHRWSKSTLQVDFEKPWWHLIWQARIPLLMVTLGEGLDTAYQVIMPLLIGWAITVQRFDWILWILMGWLVITTIRNAVQYLNAVWQPKIRAGIQFAAIQFFLNVDPLFHATRSSGQVIAKTDRGSESYLDIVDLCIKDILQALIAGVILCITLLSISLPLGLVCVCTLSIIVVLSILTERYTQRLMLPTVIHNDDQLKQVQIESLQQVQFIRSAFATPEQLQAVAAAIRWNREAWGTNWILGISFRYSVRVLYVITAGIIVLMVAHLIQTNQISLALGTSLIVTYILNSKDIREIGRYVEKYSKAVIKIEDLFQFIRAFGKQTYPVLEQTT